MVKIATAHSRLSKKWKNEEMKWSELVERLRQPTITQETFAEYQKMSKADKANAKDVGGFVGGWLKQGRRKAGHVELRSLLTLDLDQAEGDLLESLDLVFNWQGVAYSTHSHSSESPRFRLVFLLDRDVTADEYQALSRQVANDIGMSQFDPTSFQPERLMYWPSVARDGEFVSQELAGDPIPVDDLLSKYPNWTDTTYWPLHPLEHEAHRSKNQRVENPLDKKGWIGAFCHAYSISDVINQFLEGVYLPGSKPDRYTYAGGSTSDGLVVYDDLLAYSHHGTDPISGMTVNAFDLVRLHKFGELDDKQRSDVKPTQCHSYKEMLALIENDELVKTELGHLNVSEAQADFADIEAIDCESVEAVNWKAKARYTEGGTLKRDPYNLELILACEPAFAGRLGYNEFMNHFEKLKKMPWDEQFNPYWTDADTALLKSYINDRYELLFGDDRIMDSLIVVSKQKPFNPVKDFILSEKWDGQQRIGNLFVTYLGAENTSYVQEVTEMWMAAAVARIFNPGCKFDNVPVLEGAQGIGKSTLIHKLGGEWFTDGLQKLDGNKDDLQLLAQSWVVELSELASMSRTHIDQAKGFISRTVDSYRPPYGRMTVNQKRHVVFIGTTNNAEFLKDATGNRRWYPITCRKGKQIKSVFDGSLDDCLGQLWAEAHELYRSKYNCGNHLILSNGNELVANEARQAAEAPDVTKDLVLEYLEIPKPVDWQELSDKERDDFILAYRQDSILDLYNEDDLELQDFVTSREVFDLMFSHTNFAGKTSMANSEIRKIGMVLGSLEDWESAQKKIKGRNTRGYKKVEKKTAEIIDFLT